MTRKDELEKWALNFLHQHNHFKNGKPQNCDAECLTQALLQVEREVWGKFMDKIETEMAKENESTDDQIWEIRDWCKQQKEQV